MIYGGVDIKEINYDTEPYLLVSFSLLDGRIDYLNNSPAKRRRINFISFYNGVITTMTVDNGGTATIKRE